MSTVTESSRLDPRVLNQLLLLQGALHVFRDFERLASFVERGLDDLPGVRRVQLLPTESDARSSPAGGVHEQMLLPVQTSLRQYGSLELEVTDRLELEPYLPSLRNAANVVAVHLERQAREEALQLLNADLERQVSLTRAAEEREHKVEMRRLRSLKAQRSQRLEALGTLASGIAHEFRNLLQIILGSAELMTAEVREIEQSPDLDNILGAAERGSALTAQLLTFARHSEPSLAPVDLNAIVRRLESMLRRTLPREIVLDVRLDSDLCPTLGDPAQIEQAVINLALNGADAMPGGGHLTLETRLGRAPDIVELVVSDTGCGITPEHLEHIFEPFFTTKSPGKGTGLGLAVVYGIVTGHGGKISVSSEPGAGATFVVSLRRSEGVIETESLDRGAIGELESETGAAVVLVVDDEAAIRRVMAKGLSRRGYEVHAAESGEQALEFLRSKARPVDLVILDLGMPGMGGRRCLEELRRSWPDLRVLVASGYAPDRESMKTLEGAAGFVSKPIRLGRLAAEIRDALDSTGAGR